MRQKKRFLKELIRHRNARLTCLRTWLLSLARGGHFFKNWLKRSAKVLLSHETSGAGTFFRQGGLKIVRSCQRLGGEAPQTPLFRTHVFKSRTLSRPILIDINCMPLK